MKERIQLRCLHTPEEIARAAAIELLGLLKRRTDPSVPFGVALSGGRIASSFYECVVDSCRHCPASFENVHFFWADERCVPPADPENNYAIAKKHLFTPLEIPAENVHRIRGEVDLHYAVQEAEAELCRIMPLNASGQPVLDLVILGMGEDGHTASLFPEEDPQLVSDSRVYRPVVAKKPPPQRITLGYRPLIEACEALVLIPGEAKRATLQKAVAGDPNLPIARILASRTRTVVLQDSLPPASSESRA